jgi:hypothetical protein
MYVAGGVGNGTQSAWYVSSIDAERVYYYALHYQLPLSFANETFRTYASNVLGGWGGRWYGKCFIYIEEMTSQL